MREDLHAKGFDQAKYKTKGFLPAGGSWDAMGRTKQARGYLQRLALKLPGLASENVFPTGIDD